MTTRWNHNILSKLLICRFQALLHIYLMLFVLISTVSVTCCNLSNCKYKYSRYTAHKRCRIQLEELTRWTFIRGPSGEHVGLPPPCPRWPFQSCSLGPPPQIVRKGCQVCLSEMKKRAQLACLEHNLFVPRMYSRFLWSVETMKDWSATSSHNLHSLQSQFCHQQILLPHVIIALHSWEFPREESTGVDLVVLRKMLAENCLLHLWGVHLTNASGWASIG